MVKGPENLEKGDQPKEPSPDDQAWQAAAAAIEAQGPPVAETQQSGADKVRESESASVDATISRIEAVPEEERTPREKSSLEYWTKERDRKREFAEERRTKEIAYLDRLIEQASKELSLAEHNIADLAGPGPELTSRQEHILEQSIKNKPLYENEIAGLKDQKAQLEQARMAQKK